MKAIKSPLAASILSTKSGIKAIRDWINSGAVEGSVWHQGKLWMLKFMGKAK